MKTIQLTDGRNNIMMVIVSHIAYYTDRPKGSWIRIDGESVAVQEDINTISYLIDAALKP